MTRLWPDDGQFACVALAHGVASCPLTYAALYLVSMLLQNDANQLTARPDSSLGKQLLKGGFDGAFGNSDPRRYFFVSEALEYK